MSPPLDDPLRTRAGVHPAFSPRLRKLRMQQRGARRYSEIRSVKLRQFLRATMAGVATGRRCRAHATLSRLRDGPGTIAHMQPEAQGEKVFGSLRPFLSGATVLQLGAELACLCLAGVAAFWLEGHLLILDRSAIVPALIFPFVMVCLNWAFGLYRRDHQLTFSAYVGRLFLALLIGAPTAYLTAGLVPGGAPFQATLGAAVMLAFVGLVVVRRVVVSPLLGTLLPHRVLVLGTGPEARVVEASLAAAGATGLRVAAFYPLANAPENVVSAKQLVTAGDSLEDTVRTLDIDEIIVAVREQRGGVLPLRQLLDCRLSGVQVTDLARFFERVHGLIPTDSLKASWLIYGHGFRQGWWRTFSKRTFDIVFSALLLVFALPIIGVTVLMIALEDGAPILYRQERVGLRGRTFNVLKFRTMRKDAEKDGKASWASVGDTRITRVGRVLRRSRIDELPQLINVLRGEMSLVGPRPERPVFVQMLTEQIPFYGVRHSVKPGLTGWAQVRYSYGATVEQSMKKLEYDLYYVKNHTIVLDLLILLETIRVVLLGEGAR
jgi:sugar transferase (PEP-CTERM system associated)